MDPNAALETIRYAVRHQNDIEAYETDFGLLEAVEALDEWLSKGGYLPLDWATYQSPNH
jgi:hypothetical protein